MSRKRGQIKPFSFLRCRAIPFSIELTPVASPPTRLYIPRRPAVNVFQGGTQPPLAPLLPDRPQFQPSFHIYPYRFPLSNLRNPPNSGSRVCLNERIFLFLARVLSLSLDPFPRLASFSPFVSTLVFRPFSLFVFYSFAFLFSVRSLFVLEIRSGLPNPLFSCAVINYYLLAIHPRAHRTSCTGKLNHFYGTLYSRRFFLPAI